MNSYDVVYSRLVDGNMNSGDILIGLSTSGNSKNIIIYTYFKSIIVRFAMPA